MALIRFYTLSRLLKYALVETSLSILHLWVRKGRRKALTHIVQAGRKRDRELGRGLPLITVRQILEKLQGDKPFPFQMSAFHTADLSSDSHDTLPNYLIGMIAAAVKPLYALEIGTGGGKGTCQIAAQLREGGSMVTINPPQEWSDPQSCPFPRELTELDYIAKATQADLRFAWEGTPLEKKIHLVRADSREMDYTSLGLKFDFVFIDGSHSEEAVRRDTESVLPFLAEGAVLLWHDYESSRLSHGVDRYLHQRSRSDPWPIYVVEYITLAIQIRR